MAFVFALHAISPRPFSFIQRLVRPLFCVAWLLHVIPLSDLICIGSYRCTKEACAFTDNLSGKWFTLIDTKCLYPHILLCRQQARYTRTHPLKSLALALIQSLNRRNSLKMIRSWYVPFLPVRFYLHLHWNLSYYLLSNGKGVAKKAYSVSRGLMGLTESGTFFNIL